MPGFRRRHAAADAPASVVGRARRARGRQAGQSLVEFAVVITPLTLLMMGIVQLGLVFNAYITLSNATREAARAASIYVYDRTLTKAQNDTARQTLMRSTLTASMGLLKKTAPQLVSSDQTISYSLPTGVTDSDPRTGQYARVRGHYHLDLIVPLIADLLPLESGRLALDAEVTVVIN
jgi:Flp pilus assembly protein TadG